MKNSKIGRILFECMKKLIKWLENNLDRNHIYVLLYNKDLHKAKTGWIYLNISNKQLLKHK